MKSQDNEKDIDNHVGRVMGWIISTTLGSSSTAISSV
jgi:hypothetical protein